MSWSITDLFGKKTTPSARITSAIVSLLVLAFIFFDVIKPQWQGWAFAFLGIQLVNNLYAGIDDLSIPTCKDCGLRLKYEQKIKKHVCKKEK